MGSRCIFKKIDYLTFDLDPKVKITQNIAQSPLYYVIYAPAKFRVAISNGLGKVHLQEK